MGRRRRQSEKNSWRELILFAIVIMVIYFTLALFDSSLVGIGGHEWGQYLRETWGGAVLVILMFCLYLCIAGFARVRILRLPRQILGTLQLYFSFAFLLGLLRQTGWYSDLTILTPGSIGLSVAKFFVLNIGTFGTLILVVCSFLFASYLFGSRILNLSLPSFGSFNFSRVLRLLSSIHLPQFRAYQDDEPIVNRPSRRRATKKDINMRMRNSISDDVSYSPYPYEFPPVELPEPEFMRSENRQTRQNDENLNSNRPKDNDAVDILENLISSIEAGAFSAPSKRRRAVTPRHKKNRRPFPAVQPFSISTQSESALNNDDNYGNQDDGIFPPPFEIFGPKVNYEDIRNDKSTMNSETEKQCETIVSALKGFGVSVSVANVIFGPSVIQFQLELAPGTKIEKISGLAEDLAMALAVTSVRVEAPILGTHYVGIEIPNPHRKSIPLRMLLESSEFKNTKARLPLPVGLRVNSKVLVCGLEDMPYLLIAGSETEVGVFMSNCILGMCSRRTPYELKLILIDPKRIEFAVYDGLPHLLLRPLKDPTDVINALAWISDEADRRIESFARFRVRNIISYNKKVSPSERIPDIVIVIDGLSDLIYAAGQRSGEELDFILAILKRAGISGIYLILAVGDFKSEIISNLIRANSPACAAFNIPSQSDLLKNLAINDADKLTGKGDMLFRNAEQPQPVRLQTPFVTEEQASDFVEYMQSVFGGPDIVNI